MHDLTKFNEIFKIKKRQLISGAWWWSFWLFFIENKKNPNKPLQLMILWSTKFNRKLSCNDYPHFEKKADLNNLKGMVACWFFDGEKMIDNFLLSKSKIEKKENEKILISNANDSYSSFNINEKNEFIVKINPKEKTKPSFEFISFFDDFHEETKPKCGEGETLGGIFTFMISRLDRLKLKGHIKENDKITKINGTSYFQDVTVDCPVGPWYWGHFHFKDKSILSYFNVYFGNSIVKDNGFKIKKQKRWFSIDINLVYYDAKTKKVYRFKKKIDVKNDQKKLPTFIIESEDEKYKIYVNVKTYSHSCWAFKGNIITIPIKSNFKYNEYPSIASGHIIDKKTNEKIVEFENGIGNSENSWGFFF